MSTFLLGFSYTSVSGTYESPFSTSRRDLFFIILLFYLLSKYIIYHNMFLNCICNFNVCICINIKGA